MSSLRIYWIRIDKFIAFDNLAIFYWLAELIFDFSRSFNWKHFVDRLTAEADCCKRRGKLYKLRLLSTLAAKAHARNIVPQKKWSNY
jgi:hypothetical protein